MTKIRLRTTSLAAVFLIALMEGATGNAQTSKGYVSGKVGMNTQWAEDGESGQSLGGGLAVGYFPHPKWGVEFEVWVPAYMKQSEKQFRDILMGVAAVRRWDCSHFQPRLTMGIDYARVEVRSPYYRNNNSYGYIKTGFDLPILFHKHWAVVPQIRFELGGVGSNILRPALGIEYHF